MPHCLSFYAQDLRDKADEIDRMGEGLEALAMQGVPAALAQLAEKFPGASVSINIEISRSPYAKGIAATFRAWTGSRFTQTHGSLKAMIEEIGDKEPEQLTANEVSCALVGPAPLPL